MSAALARTAVFLAIWTSVFAVPSSAQNAAPICGLSIVPADSSSGPPDLILRASATADQVRFDSQPQIEVRITGGATSDTVRVLERRNLPDPIQPGVTYRDVSVVVEIAAHLAIECSEVLRDAAGTPGAVGAAGSPARSVRSGDALGAGPVGAPGGPRGNTNPAVGSPSATGAGASNNDEQTAPAVTSRPTASQDRAGQRR
jgi:hypothetical protein